MAPGCSTHNIDQKQPLRRHCSGVATYEVLIRSYEHPSTSFDARVTGTHLAAFALLLLL